MGGCFCASAATLGAQHLNQLVELSNCSQMIALYIYYLFI